MEGVDSDVTNKNSSQNVPLSSSYETAMEALTSLITSQKRGLKIRSSHKYKKLERMSMYIKVRCRNLMICQLVSQKNIVKKIIYIYVQLFIRCA